MTFPFLWYLFGEVYYRLPPPFSSGWKQRARRPYRALLLSKYFREALFISQFLLFTNLQAKPALCDHLTWPLIFLFAIPTGKGHVA